MSIPLKEIGQYRQRRTIVFMLLLLWGVLTSIQAKGAFTTAVTIDPPIPTPRDNITLKLSDRVGSACETNTITIANNTIRVDIYDYNDFGHFCIEIIPPPEEIPINPLPIGSYQVTITYASGSDTPREVGRADFMVKEPVTGSFTPVKPVKVVCQNLTTRKRTVIRNPGDFWDCQAAGLEIRPGDSVSQKVIGIADESK